MDSTLACLAAWMPRQRWYAAKGRTPHLRLVASWDLPAPGAGVRIRTLLVADEGALPPVLYQVPVVARATTTLASDDDHVIGSPEPGTTLIDGPHDPAYAAALFALVTRGGTGQGPHATATGRVAPSAPHVGSSPSAAVLSGEQSNTSIIFTPREDDRDGPAVICKVFRQLHAGLNPDIELQTALSGVASPAVPRSIGWIDGEWPDTATARSSVSGSLAFAQEFLPGTEDAWRVALRAAAEGEDFSAPARELGRATADVHAALATLFPTRETTLEDRAELLALWRRRLATAIAEVPPLAEYRTAIDEAYARATDSVWPQQQRIHGDYHLGQVISVPGRGWVLLDFEGEPLRPMTERAQTDLVLRDVAGMLRSFDYVAGSIRLDRPDRSADAVRGWTRVARAAFRDGYAQRSDIDLRETGALLEALEIDKAVYEAIYEARNRPTWITIPLQAIERLTRRPVAR